MNYEVKKMRKYNAEEIREKYLKFFESKKHKIISSKSIIPENDPTVLFITAGMQPLVPYLLGENHPQGTKLTNVQRCVRTGDIEEVGDDTHCTFFEMLGNWSLGDYFKKDSIKWSWEFLTSEEWLGIDKSRLYFTVFEGDEDAPRDEESYQYWLDQGVNKDHIFFLSKKDNWWGPAGESGPCGPDTEIFIETNIAKCSDECNPSCDCGRFIEIWNNVFMEYNKDENGTYTLLKQKNVDTGMGLERILVALNGGSVYETDLFEQTIEKIKSLGEIQIVESETEKSIRIIADHIRTSTFMLGDHKGIVPSNVDQGYVLRRLIRRAARYAQMLNINHDGLIDIAQTIIDKYQKAYPELLTNEETIKRELNKELIRFSKTLNQGLKEFEKVINRLSSDHTIISGTDAFRLYDTFGFPIEFTQELASERNLEIDMVEYQERFNSHRLLSQEGGAKKFKGGLADNSTETTRLHTATHLLHEALRRVLGVTVEQRGSNITPERLRFDFTFDRKVTKDEIKLVEEIVNKQISKGLEISNQEMNVKEAKESGAIGLFENRYDEKVKVYTIGDFSKEICGGPHVVKTNELGVFKVLKEESSSSGVRRIKAKLV